MVLRYELLSQNRTFKDFYTGFFLFPIIKNMKGKHKLYPSYFFFYLKGCLLYSTIPLCGDQHSIRPRINVGRTRRRIEIIVHSTGKYSFPETFSFSNLIFVFFNLLLLSYNSYFLFKVN